MDRTRTRFGRYRVYLTLGAPLLVGALFLLMRSPEGVGQGYLFACLIGMYVGYSWIYLSHLAWAGVIAPSYKQRSRVFGAITGLGVVGAMGVLIIPVVMSRLGHTDAEGVQAMIWFIIGLIPITVLLALATTPERVARDHTTHFQVRDYFTLLARGNVIRILLADFTVTLGPGWMAALYLFYFKDSRGFDTAAANVLLAIYIGAGFVGAPFAAWLGNKLSKHRALIVCTTIYSLGLVAIPFLPKGSFWAFAPGMFLVGAVAAGFTVMIRAITADIADEVRLETGREWMGLMYAITTATTKAATACALLITFPLLDRIGYHAKEGAANTPEAIQGLQLAYIIGPIVFVMIAGACFIGYRLTADRHAEIRRLLEEREVAADAAAALESLDGDPELAAAGRVS